MDARVMDEVGDPLVAPAVLLTQELGELQQQLTAQHLVPMHVPDVLELWLHWRKQESDTISQGWDGRKSQFLLQEARSSPKDPQ